MIPFTLPPDDETVVQGTMCLDLRIPWIVPEAIQKLNEVLSKSDTVLEIGSGGSTLFFAERCGKVITIETSEQWLNHTMHKANELGVSNTTFHISLTDSYTDSVIKKHAHEVTVLSIDTQGGIDRSRLLSEFIIQGPPKLRVIVLDNYAHPELFPYHFDKGNYMGGRWEMFTYDHPRWSGNGTRIFIKKEA